MWLATWAAAEAAGNSVPTSTIVAGLIALASAALAAWLGARGTLRTADVQREQAFDRRVDDRLAKSEEELGKALAELRRYQEMYAKLRVGVIEARLDPDNMPRKGAPDDPA